MVGLCDDQGRLLEDGTELRDRVIAFYQELLGSEMPCPKIDHEAFSQGPVLSRKTMLLLLDPYLLQK